MYWSFSQKSKQVQAKMMFMAAFYSSSYGTKSIPFLYYMLHIFTKTLHKKQKIVTNILENFLRTKNLSLWFVLFFNDKDIWHSVDNHIDQF